MSPRDELINLVKKSVSLDSREQTFFLKEIPGFTDDEIMELLGIFRLEQKKLSLIQGHYQNSVTHIDQEFRQLVSEFKHNKFPAALREHEKKLHEQDENDADKLLQNLDTSP